MPYAALWDSGAAQAVTAAGQSPVLTVSSWSVIEVVVAVTGAVAGTTPALTVNLDGFDPAGDAYFLGGFGTAISAAGDYAYGVGPGTGNSNIVPATIQLTWAVAGTTPSFGGVRFSLYGR